MTPEDLATYTGVTLRTVQRWVSRDAMPMLGSKSNRVISRHDFLVWAAVRGHVRDAIVEPIAVRDIVIYHKAAMYDLIHS